MTYTLQLVSEQDSDRVEHWLSATVADYGTEAEAEAAKQRLSAWLKGRPPGYRWDADGSAFRQYESDKAAHATGWPFHGTAPSLAWERDVKATWFGFPDI